MAGNIRVETQGKNKSWILPHTYPFLPKFLYVQVESCPPSTLCSFSIISGTVKSKACPCLFVASMAACLLEGFARNSRGGLGGLALRAQGKRVAGSLSPCTVPLSTPLAPDCEKHSKVFSPHMPHASSSPTSPHAHAQSAWPRRALTYQVDWVDVAVLILVIGQDLPQVSNVAGGQPQGVQFGKFGVWGHPG